MKTLARTYIYIIAAALLAWLLPWTFRFVAARPVNAPFTLYSCITKNFAFLESDKDKETVRRDASGRTYTATQFDSILPTFYYRQLMAKNRLPDTICGVAVKPADIRRTNFIMRQSTRDINAVAPQVWMLMESIPSHVDLESPCEAFRMTDRMTVIRMSDNSTDEAKSNLFNKVMAGKGFSFPLYSLHGNPTTKKEYDEGYIMIDDSRQVFHVKQMKGRPYVKNVGLDTTLRMKRAMIAEYPDREILAFLTDEQNRFYVLDRQYSLRRLPFAYDPERNDILIIGDMFNWTAKVTDGRGYSVYALDAKTLATVDTLRSDYKVQQSEMLSEAIFPFTLSFTSADDKWVKPRLGGFSTTAFALNLALAAVFLFLQRRRVTAALPAVAAILVFGIFMFIPALIFR